MEINQPAASEVSSHGSPDHEQQVQTQSQQQPTRSYECNFCKKGFSNAQALGGHMNIHRKDKAKLKQASKETQRLMDNSTLTPLRSTKPLDVTSGKVRSNAKWPCIYSSDHLHESSYPSPRDGSHVSELKQLPLFVEKASSPDYSNPIIHASANWQEELHYNHGSFGAELDLELRLGHEPPKSSVARAGTRKFF